MNPELKSRIITALVLLAVVLSLLFLSAYSIIILRSAQALISLIAVVAAYEYARFSSSGIVKILEKTIALTLPVSMFWLELSTHSGFWFKVSPLMSVALLFVVAVLRNIDNLNQSKEDLASLLPAALLISFGAFALLKISADPHFQPVITWLLLVVIANDVAAYFAGKKLGGERRMFPAISPGKTPVGYLFGFVSGVLLGTLFSFLLPVSFTIIASLVFSCWVVLFAQIGDLLESYLKRIHAVKDSGSILPGHGGVLDRIDAVFFASTLLVLVVC